MARSVIVHLLNTDPVVADMEELPSPTATTVAFTNARSKDGKPFKLATSGATAFIFPIAQIYFIEVMTSEEERAGVVEFYRDR